MWLGDNMSSIYMTEKPGKHRRVKNIESKSYMPSDLVEKKELEVQHVGTNDMVADIVTKGLGATKFECFRTMLEVPPQKELSEASAAVEVCLCKH
ncbi:hypothetical protein PI124_g17730 [Phytophthora idaei]|nr:hypothetical protein PI125_g18692 [Phytophthora idaei]KAG3137671.1 hypothetical protein PI126_g17280 [Phytophthora idaei]KAG3237281.1 hypothetical protein PI124_g17730 [Phytophthora idaei]